MLSYVSKTFVLMHCVDVCLGRAALTALSVIVLWRELGDAYILYKRANTPPWLAHILSGCVT